MIHSCNNSPPISLSFKLAFVVPRRCIYAFTPIKRFLDYLIHIGQGINYRENNPLSILILLLVSVNK